MASSTASCEVAKIAKISKIAKSQERPINAAPHRRTRGNLGLAVRDGTQDFNDDAGRDYQPIDLKNVRFGASGEPKTLTVGLGSFSAVGGSEDLAILAILAILATSGKADARGLEVGRGGK